MFNSVHNSKHGLSSTISPELYLQVGWGGEADALGDQTQEPESCHHQDEEGNPPKNLFNFRGILLDVILFSCTSGSWYFPQTLEQ